MADDPAQYLCALCVLYQQKMVVGCFLALFVVGVFFLFYFIIVLAVQMLLSSVHREKNKVQLEKNHTRDSGTTEVLFKKRIFWGLK